MSISANDIVFRKSVTVTDTAANGGRKSQTVVLSGVRHSLFPRVTRAERTAGVTRYRKEFFCNDNADDDIAFGLYLFLEFPSNGGDRFAIGKGTQTDLQSGITASPVTYPIWLGVGQLQTVLAGGELEVALTMENTDFEFPNNGYLHLADKFLRSQTIDSAVSIGDSVECTGGGPSADCVGGTWGKIAATSEIDFPKGLYVGSNVVMTIQSTTNEEWLQIAEKKTTDEDIGTGDGADQTPVLTDLANGANGISKQTGGFRPVVTTLDTGDVTMTVNIDSTGLCTGDCSAGQLNMTSGVWTTDITWTTAPKSSQDILITYYENAFSYSGNVCTVELQDQVANAYSVAGGRTVNTYGGGCIEQAEVTPTTDSWVEVSVSGAYDESTYPVIMFNDGTEEDTWTLTFTSATAFTVSGVNAGSVGTGSISVDFSPVNANTGQPYFTIDSSGWAGTWTSGETVTFKTHPAAVPVWWREIVPVATVQEPNNLAILGWYAE